MYYTITVPAEFSFTVSANSQAAAEDTAREMLTKRDPVDNGHFRLGYEDPFIAVHATDKLVAELDDWLTAEDERLAAELGIEIGKGELTT